MRTSRICLKGISLVVVLTFGTTQIAYSAPRAVTGSAPSASSRLNINDLAANPFQLNIPFEHVDLKEVHTGTNGRLIIHIQDAHSNLSGQKSLAAALDHFMTRYHVPLVLVEGAAKDVTLDPLKRMHASEDWRRAARRFLYDGVISGEEYLNLTSDHPMKLMGIEYRDLYDENLRSYAELKDRRKDLLLYLHQVGLSLERIKGQLYPKNLLAYEETRRTKGWKDVDFEDRISALFNLAQEAGIGVGPDFSQLRKLRDLQEKEKQIRFEKVDAERTDLFRALSEKGADVALKSHIRASKEMRRRQVAQYVLLGSIFETARQKGLRLKDYPELIKYRDYLRDFTQLEFDGLLEEIEALEAEVYKDLLRDDKDALRVRAIDRFLTLLRKAYGIRMSSREFALFKANQPEFDTRSWQAILNQKLFELGFYESFIPYKPDLEEASDLLMRFYATVDQRDLAFVENANRIMAEQGQNAAFLIAGGYHTQHLTRLLREEGASYVVLTPVVGHETDHDKYEQLLLTAVGGENSRLRKDTVRKISLLARGGNRLLSASYKDVPVISDDRGFISTVTLLADEGPQNPVPRFVSAAQLPSHIQTYLDNVIASIPEDKRQGPLGARARLLALALTAVLSLGVARADRVWAQFGDFSSSMNPMSPNSPASQFSQGNEIWEDDIIQRRGNTQAFKQIIGPIIDALTKADSPPEEQKVFLLEATADLEPDQMIDVMIAVADLEIEGQTPEISTIVIRDILEPAVLDRDFDLLLADGLERNKIAEVLEILSNKHPDPQVRQRAKERGREFLVKRVVVGTLASIALGGGAVIAFLLLMIIIAAIDHRTGLLSAKSLIFLLSLPTLSQMPEFKQKVEAYAIQRGIDPSTVQVTQLSPEEQYAQLQQMVRDEILARPQLPSHIQTYLDNVIASIPEDKRQGPLGARAWVLTLALTAILSLGTAQTNHVWAQFDDFSNDITHPLNPTNPVSPLNPNSPIWDDDPQLTDEIAFKQIIGPIIDALVKADTTPEQQKAFLLEMTASLKPEQVVDVMMAVADLEIKGETPEISNIVLRDVLEPAALSQDYKSAAGELGVNRTDELLKLVANKHPDPKVKQQAQDRIEEVAAKRKARGWFIAKVALGTIGIIAVLGIIAFNWQRIKTALSAKSLIFLLSLPTLSQMPEFKQKVEAYAIQRGIDPSTVQVTQLSPEEQYAQLQQMVRDEIVGSRNTTSVERRNRSLVEPLLIADGLDLTLNRIEMREETLRPVAASVVAAGHRGGEYALAQTYQSFVLFGIAEAVQTDGDIQEGDFRVYDAAASENSFVIQRTDTARITRTRQAPVVDIEALDFERLAVSRQIQTSLKNLRQGLRLLRGDGLPKTPSTLVFSLDFMARAGEGFVNNTEVARFYQYAFENNRDKYGQVTLVFRVASPDSAAVQALNRAIEAAEAEIATTAGQPVEVKARMQARRSFLYSIRNGIQAGLNVGRDVLVSDATSSVGYIGDVASINNDPELKRQIAQGRISVTPTAAPTPEEVMDLNAPIVSLVTQRLTSVNSEGRRTMREGVEVSPGSATLRFFQNAFGPETLPADVGQMAVPPDAEQRTLRRWQALQLRTFKYIWDSIRDWGEKARSWMAAA